MVPPVRFLEPASTKHPRRPMAYCVNCYARESSSNVPNEAERPAPDRERAALPWKLRKRVPTHPNRSINDLLPHGWQPST